MPYRMALALFVALIGSSLNATVIGGDILRQSGVGNFVKLDAAQQFAVGNDTFDDCNLYAFDEDQNIKLPVSIRVDIGPETGVVPQGTVVASHYVFFDSISGIHHGYIDFDAPILGVATQQDTMAATDFLANTLVNYISVELRGLEQGDHVWIDEENPNRLWVYWAGSSPGDFIRVFTAQSMAAMM